MPPNNPRTSRTVAEMLSHVPEGQLTVTQALAWLMFRDTSKGDFADICDLVPVALEVPALPPKRSKAERRLDALARSPRLHRNDRHIAFLGAQDRRARRLRAKTRFQIDPATGGPAIDMRPRRSSSALLALATAHGLADKASRFLALADAVRALVAACAAGKIVVTGLRSGAGDRAVIDAAWWTDARLCDGPEPYFVLARGRPGASEWHDLLFDRVAVEQLWLAVAVPAAPSRAAPAQRIKRKRPGPKPLYMPDLIKRLRVIKMARPEDFENDSAYALTHSVQRQWPYASKLPSSRSRLEKAIDEARAVIRAADAAVAPQFTSAAPQFPSTTSAATTR